MEQTFEHELRDPVFSKIYEGLNIHKSIKTFHMTFSTDSSDKMSRTIGNSS